LCRFLQEYLGSHLRLRARQKTPALLRC